MAFFPPVTWQKWGCSAVPALGNMGRDFNKSSVPPCSHWQQQAFKNVNGASLQSQWWALLAKIPRIKVLVSVFLVLWMEWRCICLVIDSEAFQKSKGGNKLELLCSIRVKTSQALCAENQQQTMSSTYARNKYKVLKQEDQEAWHQDVRLYEAYFKYRQTQTVHIFHAGMFSIRNQPFFTPSLSLLLKPIKITAVLFFIKFSAALYLGLHLKYTILCWYLGQPHWEGESHYCLLLFLKWMNL